MSYNRLLTKFQGLLGFYEGTFVKKISGDKTTQEPVTVGMRAKNGDVEVISGVVEGEVVENIGIKK